MAKCLPPSLFAARLESVLIAATLRFVCNNSVALPGLCYLF
jgi:hypothetical protein